MSRIAGCLLLLAAAAIIAPEARASDGNPPSYLRDRGTGLPTSMFGTYIRKGELLVYPFFEYYRDNDMEYSPAELGYGVDRDFRGRYRASEGLIFLGYGIADWLAIELEAAIISASLETAPDDLSSPTRIEESGTGDVEGQLRARFVRERERRPEVFGYFEVVSPQQRRKPLIGTPDWEFKLGAGLVKGFPWGTMTVRAAGEYVRGGGGPELGEYAVEYLKRLGPSWRAYVGIEGAQDEIALIAEAQWHVSESVFLKLNNAIGLTSKATDWAPEVGCMIVLPVVRR